MASMISDLLQTPQQLREAQLNKLRALGQTNAQNALLAGRGGSAISGAISGLAAQGQSILPETMENAKRQGLLGLGSVAQSLGANGLGQSLQTAAVPAAERAAAAQQAAVKGADTATVEGLRTAAMKLRQAGNAPMAMKLEEMADTKEAAQTEARYKAAVLKDKQTATANQAAYNQGRLKTNEERLLMDRKLSEAKAKYFNERDRSSGSKQDSANIQLHNLLQSTLTQAKESGDPARIDEAQANLDSFFKNVTGRIRTETTELTEKGKTERLGLSAENKKELEAVKQQYKFELETFKNNNELTKQQNVFREQGRKEVAETLQPLADRAQNSAFLENKIDNFFAKWQNKVPKADREKFKSAPMEYFKKWLSDQDTRTAFINDSGKLIQGDMITTLKQLGSNNFSNKDLDAASKYLADPEGNPQYLMDYFDKMRKEARETKSIYRQAVSKNPNNKLEAQQAMLDSVEGRGIGKKLGLAPPELGDGTHRMKDGTTVEVKGGYVYERE
jgi:hypothetical protein